MTQQKCPSRTSMTSYPVTVNYKKPLKSMIAAGRYRRTDPWFTSATFSMPGTGAILCRLVLLRFKRDIRHETVLRHLKRQHLEPARIEHLLAFGATYPDVQQQFRIVAFGSSLTNQSGNVFVPYLDCYSWGSRRPRYLGMTWRDLGWPSGYRFLAVRLPKKRKQRRR